MLFGFPILSVVIWLPIIFGLFVLIIGNDHRVVLVRWISLLGSTLGFIVALPLYTGFDSTLSSMQFVEQHIWFERFNVYYHLGIDGISMPLILLNCLITPLVVIAGWEVIRDRTSQYFGAFLIMSGIVNGVFASLDAVLFYTFWEASLIPMFIIIGIWGGPNRVYAAIKFFLYTLLG
nr:proton-conducting transporter membrane subunit [Nitrosomonas sp.]